MRDFTQPRLFIERAYEQETLRDRYERLQASGKCLVESNKDDFYAKLMGELEDVNQHQAKYYRESRDSSVMRCSIGDFLTKKITGERLSDSQTREVYTECKNMR